MGASMVTKRTSGGALGVRSYLIEQFGKRVKWMVSNLSPEPHHANVIHNLTELWRAIASAADLDVSRSEKTWDRCVAPKGTYRVPESIVGGLLSVFPDLSRKMLLAETFDDFEKHGHLIAEARERWLKAAAYHSKNRGVLADLGKRYHKSVDAEPEFPLIVKPGWILSKPVLMGEDTSLPEWDPDIREPEAKRLEGLNVDYVNLVSRRMPKERRPTNRESYRLLDLKPQNGTLSVTLGMTRYFQVVNTCEAIGTELADHVLRHGFAVPKLLPLRGAPEAIFDFKKRSTYPSVICVLLLKNYPVGGHSRKNKFVLHDRGETTVEAQNTTHVVPAGGHQPLAEGYGDEKELSLWNSVVREFCEELFNKEDANKLRRLGESFIELPEVKPYVDVFFRNGAAKVYLLGGGLDPVTTKCEILFAVVVDWAKAATKMQLRFEENYEGRIRLIDLSREKLRSEAARPMGNKPFVPSGKACLLLAAKHYNFLMG
jgi:hypothetical protein